MEIVKLKAHSERVNGVRWDVGLADTELDDIETALSDHGVLVLDAARMKPEQHVSR